MNSTKECIYNMANIQQSINQLLGTATIGAGLYKNYKTQADQLKLAQEDAEYNKPENVKARRIEELKSKIKPAITKGVDREKALVEQGWELEEAQVATARDLHDEQKLYSELYDLTGEMGYMESWAEVANLEDYYRQELSDQQQNKIKAEQEVARRQEEDKKKQEESEKIRSQIMEGAPQTNITPREVIRPDERRDWKASAMNKLETRDKFTAFLDSLQNQMWDNQGGAK